MATIVCCYSQCTYRLLFFFPIVEKNVPCEGLCKFDLQNCGLFPRKGRELKASFHSLLSQETPRVDLEGLLVENSACQRWKKEMIIQKKLPK